METERTVPVTCIAISGIMVCGYYIFMNMGSSNLPWFIRFPFIAVCGYGIYVSIRLYQMEEWARTTIIGLTALGIIAGIIENTYLAGNGFFFLRFLFGAAVIYYLTREDTKGIFS